MSGPQIRRSQAVAVDWLRDRTHRSSVSEHITNTSAEAQRNRLLAYLKRNSITTIDARSLLNIMMPAARCFELRKLGHNIVSRPVDIHDDQGRLHRRVAHYSLISGGAK